MPAVRRRIRFPATPTCSLTKPRRTKRKARPLSIFFGGEFMTVKHSPKTYDTPRYRQKSSSARKGRSIRSRPAANRCASAPSGRGPGRGLVAERDRGKQLFFLELARLGR